MRGLQLPRGDLKNSRIEDLKNLRIEDHRAEDRGFNPFTTIHDGNFRRHSSMNVTIK